MHPLTLRPAAEELILHLTRKLKVHQLVVGSAFAHQFMVFQALTTQAQRF